MDTIDVENIDTRNTTYCISFPLEDDFVLSSMRQFGFLSPIGLIRADKSIIVTGHKWVHSAKVLGITQIPFYYIEFPEKKALLTAILNSADRPLNTVEKARCIERVVSFRFSQNEIESIQKLLGLPIRQKTVETAISLAISDESFKSFVVNYGISMTTVAHLLWFDDNERTRITDLLESLHPSTSYLRDVVHLLMLLKVRIGSIDFSNLIDAKDIESLRRKIKLLTHPVLSNMENTLENIIKSAALPPQIRLSVDPAFERDWIEINLKFRSASDIDKGLNKIKQIQSQGYLQRILDLTHGTTDPT
jgi:hypothetical protein